MRLRLSSLLFPILGLTQALFAADSPPKVEPVSINVIQALRQKIDALKQANQHYQPKYIYVVDPSTQRLHLLSAESYTLIKTYLVGTGSKGLGFGDGQTPPGFYTMGGVRVASGPFVQTGDSRPGVSGVYAELLYPPGHPKEGSVPNNVVIHSFNPAVSAELRRRYDQKLIGKQPCTTGCPVLRPEDVGELAPKFIESAGSFDPATKPGSALSKLIRDGKVRQYPPKKFLGLLSKKLGDPIYIIPPASPAPSSGS